MQNFSFNRKSLALAGSDVEPSFEHVARAAATAALCDMSVQVLCLSHEQLERWRRYLGESPLTDTNLQIYDLNRSTVSEWRTVLGRRSAHMTVLAGFRAARRSHGISPEYANALVDAVPSGMVVVA